MCSGRRGRTGRRKGGTGEPRAGGAGEEIRRRHAWLELLQVSGPFLTLPAVHRVFPDGLPEVPARHRARVRGLVAQMMDDGGAGRHAVIQTLPREVFGWGQHLVTDGAVPDTESGDRLCRHRRAIERTLAWLTGRRRLTLGYERRASHFLAFLTLGATITCHRKLAKHTT